MLPKNFKRLTLVATFFLTFYKFDTFLIFSCNIKVFVLLLTLETKSPFLLFCFFLISLQLFPIYQDFDVVHDYLATSNPKIQARLRRRGQNGKLDYHS